MIIYIALVKTDDNKPPLLVVRDEAEEIREYLLSIPVMYTLQSFTIYDSGRQQVEHLSLRQLVNFLKP
ncbi:hypothetical protein ES703_110175 [subsurface metagenome]